MSDFEKFQKIPRLHKGLQMIITEKIDGTNAQINITQGLNDKGGVGSELVIQVGSRNRWITPEEDNYGFARWCHENKQELIDDLGEGRHYGEWCGLGVQKNPYGFDEKKLLLFNVGRWQADDLPCGIGLVPLLYSGEFSLDNIESVMENLLLNGNSFNGGKPEGVVIYLPKPRLLFKRTFEYEKGKWGEK